MASNIYFNNFNNSQEQELIESLVIESIGVYGYNTYYCPRTIVAKDEIYGEDTLSTYNNAYEFAMYIKSYDSYEGEGTFLSKFNLEIRDQVTFCIARRTFRDQIGANEDISRPREGDLIYSPMMSRMFVIKYVDNTAIFFQMGSLQMWDVVCEMYEYSHESFNTGIPEIDKIEDTYSVANVTSNSVFDDAMQDVFATNDELQIAANGIFDWSVIDPFSQGQV